MRRFRTFAAPPRNAEVRPAKDQPDVAALDRRLNSLTPGRPAVRAALYKRGGAARVESDRFIWKDLAKGFGYPFCRRAILAEDYRAVRVQPADVAQVMEDHLRLDLG
jgi:hypothetical protein